MGIWEILRGEQPGIINTLLNYENARQFGEYSTEFALTNDNLTGNLQEFKNLYVPHKGKTTEVDLLMLYEKGIFVFESKNYSGWIFGSADQLNWTQCLQNGEKNRFYNPIKQNETHIKALAAALELLVSAFTSYIIFSERCSLKKVPADMDSVVIVRRSDMLKYLQADLNKRSIVYPKPEMDKLIFALKGFTNKTAEEKQAHVDAIKEQLTSGVCPFCGKKLVLRKGRYGEFLGCSSYPKCHFTKQLS